MTWSPPTCFTTSTPAASATATIVPGTVPDAPPVGAAETRPIPALNSCTAIALTKAFQPAPRRDGRPARVAPQLPFRNEVRLPPVVPARIRLLHHLVEFADCLVPDGRRRDAGLSTRVQFGGLEDEREGRGVEPHDAPGRREVLERNWMCHLNTLRLARRASRSN